MTIAIEFMIKILKSMKLQKLIVELDLAKAILLGQ